MIVRQEKAMFVNFFGFQNPMFNASFGDILKIKDLQIFEIQRPPEQKVYVQ